MGSLQAARLAVLGLFLIAVQQDWLVGQDVKADDSGDGDFATLAGIFEPPGLPGIAGKRWQVADVGPDNHKETVEGWVLKETATQLVLREWNGDVTRLGKPPGGANRPLLKVEPSGGILVSEIQAADYSIAWGVKDGDYLAQSKEFLAAGLPKEQDDKEHFSMLNNRFGLSGHVVTAARYAHHAHQVGQAAHAAELVELSQRAFKKYNAQGYVGRDDLTWLGFIAHETARGLRNRAVHDAHHGKDRQELLSNWTRLAAIPDHAYRDEARDFEKQYRQLVKEDEEWREPDSAQIAKMTVEQKVNYWLYHLRDLDVGQSMNPGRCHIMSFRDLGFLNPRHGDKERPHPAEELKKLGVDAVPYLIAHLGDARPTRCKEHWRFYWPDGHHLLRYGDCCQQILDSITDRAMFGGETRREYPIAAGAEQRAKEKFAAWQQAQSAAAKK